MRTFFLWIIGLSVLCSCEFDPYDFSFHPLAGIGSSPGYSGNSGPWPGPPPADPPECPDPISMDSLVGCWQIRCHQTDYSFEIFLDSGSLRIRSNDPLFIHWEMLEENPSLTCPTVRRFTLEYAVEGFPWKDGSPVLWDEITVIFPLGMPPFFEGIRRDKDLHSSVLCDSTPLTRISCE